MDFYSCGGYLLQQGDPAWISQVSFMHLSASLFPTVSVNRAGRVLSGSRPCSITAARKYFLDDGLAHLCVFLFVSLFLVREAKEPPSEISLVF